MDLKDLGMLMILSKPLMIVVAIFAAVLLIIPILILWAYGLMTGTVFFIITLLGVLALAKWDYRSPWLVFLPFVAFFLGFIIEKARILQIAPLFSTTNQISMLSLTDQLIAFNLNTLLLLIIALLLIVGLVKKGK